MNLKTIIFVFGALVLLATLASGQSLPYNKLDKLKVNDLVAKKLEVQSTTQSSLPCPSMTQVQRDAIATPTEGSCVYNSDTNVLNIYDGSAWVEVGSGGGGAGGIANWETAKFYEVGDVVIESNKIYQANTQHTSSVFASDIAYWTQIANNVSDVTGVLPMANGGTDKNLTPVLGGVVYTDAGSMEILGAGTTGQFLKSNGAAAPSWEDVVVNDSSFSGLLSLSKGGTNKNLSAEDGAILYLDADSVEKLSPGASGQVLQSNGSGAPSFANKSISAKSENGSSVTLEEIQVSNNLLTQTDTNKHLIESGNNNILVNPSFEHSTFSTGWTNTNGVFAEESVVEIHGKKAAKVTLTAQALSLHQDSTLYQAQFADGVQGLASVRVKTSVSGIKVCSKQAGIITSNLCVDVVANNKWGLYKVPFILGGTSNGISINSNGTSVTGTVYLDDAFVGANDLTQNMNACNDVSCETEFSAKISAAGVVSDENIDWITGNASIVSTSRYTLTFKSGLFTLSPNCVATSSDSLTTTRLIQVNSVSSSSVTLEIQNSAFANTAAPFNVTCQKQGADFTAAKQLSNGNTYSSTNADTDWQACQFSTLAWQGLGTVTNNLQCKRQGSDLLMRGTFVVGSTVASQAQVPMPLWGGSQLSTKALPVASDYGRMIRNLTGANSNRDFVALGSTSSLNYFTIGIVEYASTASTLTTQNGNALFSVGESILLNLRIPIEGWQTSNLIIAQLSGLEKCENTLSCTDTFSAKISSTGVTSEENLDFINGNCSLATNVYTCNFNAGIFSVTPNCVVAPLDGAANGNMAMIMSQSSSTFSYKTVRHDSVALATGVNIICQKQGVDFVSKTAKAVASDQNLRSPGIVNSVLNSCAFTNNGSSIVVRSGYSRLCGTWISSVSRTTTGTASITLLPNTFDSSEIVCTGSVTAATFGRFVEVSVNSSTSLTVEVNAGNDSLVDKDFQITCHGVKP